MFSLVRHPRRSAALIALVVVVPFVAYAVVVATRTASPQPSAAVASATLHEGSLAPTGFTLRILGATSSSSLAALIHHRPAIINFFASWCTVCQQELDAFGAYDRQKSSRIAVVGIDTNDHDPALAMQLLHNARASFPVLSDTSSLAVALAYGIADLPVTFFVSSTGHVVAEQLGGVSEQQLQHEQAALIKIAGAT